MHNPIVTLEVINDGKTRVEFTRPAGSSRIYQPSDSSCNRLDRALGHGRQARKCRDVTIYTYPNSVYIKYQGV